MSWILIVSNRKVANLMYNIYNIMTQKVLSNSLKKLCLCQSMNINLLINYSSQNPADQSVGFGSSSLGAGVGHKTDMGDVVVFLVCSWLDKLLERDLFCRQTFFPGAS
ncbi:hypothetical protein XELAEV_18029678mg [Xenopus laevis]|uniref:Uncharacterized protein n=1 Tax=Xenopus laevis TaxID=8355 RepID=A0A974CTY2_XENLA|nr:hypothetical protein XELAEV_18029678mg [Xenopus laevis]